MKGKTGVRGDEFGGKSKGLVLDLLGFRCLIRHPSGDSKWQSGHSLELKGECAQRIYGISIRMVLAEECTYMYNNYFLRSLVSWGRSLSVETITVIHFLSSINMSILYRLKSQVSLKRMVSLTI